jgi:TPR repeat protein
LSARVALLFLVSAAPTSPPAPPCADRDPSVCHHRALKLAGPGASPENLRRAAAIYLQACDAGFAKSCSNLGVLYEEGRGVPADDARAVGLFDKSCAARDPIGCANYALRLTTGRGVAKDTARAARLMAFACSAENGQSCNNLGAFYDQGIGVAVDHHRALTMFAHACDLGIAARAPTPAPASGSEVVLRPQEGARRQAGGR